MIARTYQRSIGSIQHHPPSTTYTLAPIGEGISRITASISSVLIGLIIQSYLYHSIWAAPPCGPGLWRANPLFVKNTMYRDQLTAVVIIFFVDDHQDVDAQEQWDILKVICQDYTHRFGRLYTPWRQQTIQRLQRKRHRFNHPLFLHPSHSSSPC